MTVFLFDATFEGLLTAVYEGYYGPRRPDRIETPDHRQEGLLDEVVWIETDAGKAGRVHQAIVTRLSEEIRQHVLCAWLSEDASAGTVIYAFLRHAFKAGPAAIGHESHPAVHPLLCLSRAVTRESHRLLGLTRFMKLESGIYYSRLEPDHNVLMLLASHFEERLGDQLWVIHDVRRSIAAFYDKAAWHIAEVPPAAGLKLHAEELRMQGFWQEYFRRIAIEARRKPALQRQMMPKKYWANLVERPLGQ